MSNTPQMQIVSAAGPQGEPTVGIIHLFGNASFSWGISAEQHHVESFLEKFCESVRAAAQAARASRNGHGPKELIMPDNFDVPGLKETVLKAAEIPSDGS